jgi:regulator of sirC expression with transglutaminase-like and TPR domain
VSKEREEIRKKIKSLKEERERVLDLRVFYGEQGYRGSSDKLLLKANSLKCTIADLQNTLANLKE